MNESMSLVKIPYDLIYVNIKCKHFLQVQQTLGYISVTFEAGEYKPTFLSM